MGRRRHVVCTHAAAECLEPNRRQLLFSVLTAWSHVSRNGLFLGFLQPNKFFFVPASQLPHAHTNLYVSTQHTRLLSCAGDPICSLQLGCWCLGFLQYAAFNSALRAGFGHGFYISALTRALTGRLSILKLLDAALRPGPVKMLQHPEVHLGAFGRVGKEFEGVIMLTELIGHMAAELARQGQGCWAITSETNQGAISVMENAGFTNIGIYKETTQTNAVYEYVSR